MRSLAVVPPVLLDSRERRLCFDNRNGLVQDPMAEYRERPLLNVWTEQVSSRLSKNLWISRVASREVIDNPLMLESHTFRSTFVRHSGWSDDRKRRFSKRSTCYIPRILERLLLIWSASQWLIASSSITSLKRRSITSNCFVKRR